MKWTRSCLHLIFNNDSFTIDVIAHNQISQIVALKPNLKTRQSKQCGFSIYIFDNSKSKSMVRLVRAEKMVLSGLVFARKIARMILIQNIQGLMGPLMINMAFMPLYM